MSSSESQTSPPLLSESTPSTVLEKSPPDPAAVSVVPANSASTPSIEKGSAFWLSYISLVLSILLSALDLTAVGTALPTITQDLHGTNDFAWVGTAYALASTAFLPLSGNLADIFGRRPLMLICIAMFALGSALAGSAQSMTWLIAARTVQGIGGGGILSLSEIILSDLVPLAERGFFQGMLGLTWSFASAIGPVIGGALAERASWRWLFYINLPVSAIAFVFVLIFLRVKTPEGNIWNKLAAVDWLGNVIVIAGTTLSNVGLAWAGVHYPWSDAHVLAPLIIGLCLIAAFIVYERYVPTTPTVPWDIVANKTVLASYVGTFVHGIVSMAIFYYLPVYFQAVLEATPIRSGVDLFPSALLIAPAAFAISIVIEKTQKYLPGNYTGWILSVIGFGILSLMSADSKTAQWVGYQIVAAIGVGIVYTAPIFAILAPLPVDRAAAALAFFAFTRAFSQTWGITISATILQNELNARLPSNFSDQFPSGVEIAYAAIGIIPQLPDDALKDEVKIAFAGSMKVMWQTMIGIAGLGLISVFFMREEQMHKVKQEKFALKERKDSASPTGEPATA